jgi:Ca-activated chloride channel family protein
VNPHLAFRDPEWLWLLLLLPAAAWWRSRQATPVWLVPFAAVWHRPTLLRRTWLTPAAAVTGLVLLILAMARPQRVQERWENKTRGYDIMLAIDLSSSMLTEDYKRDGARINRFEAIKPIVQAFIEHRPKDRIGVVLFAGRAYTLSPLTFDHSWLARQLERIRIGLIEDGTAIGDAVVVSLLRLNQTARHAGTKRQGAFVVLLTDGVNNAGLFTPKEARTMAAERGVPVFTISAGRKGLVPVPYFDAEGRKTYRQERSEIDEETLWLMALGTGGRFFRGHDASTLVGAFNAISESQTIEFQSRRLLLTAELFPWLAVPGLACLGIAALLARPWWRRDALIWA